MPSQMVGWIREIVALGVRWPGSPENRASEQYLADKLRIVDLPRVAGLFRELVEAIDLIPASELRAGLTPRADAPPPLPPWFQPPPDAGTELQP